MLRTVLLQTFLPWYLDELQYSQHFSKARDALLRNSHQPTNTQSTGKCIQKAVTTKGINLDTRVEQQRGDEATCKSRGAWILATPARARRATLLRTGIGFGLSTSISTLAKNSSAEPRISIKVDFSSVNRSQISPVIHKHVFKRDPQKIQEPEKWLSG